MSDDILVDKDLGRLANIFQDLGYGYPFAKIRAYKTDEVILHYRFDTILDGVVHKKVLVDPSWVDKIGHTDNLDNYEFEIV